MLDGAQGYTLRDDDDDDPVLVRQPEGTEVDTWRENYPYDERMSRDEYEEQKRLLQIEPEVPPCRAGVKSRLCR